jgi:hypothetical protein
MKFAQVAERLNAAGRNPAGTTCLRGFESLPAHQHGLPGRVSPCSRRACSRFPRVARPRPSLLNVTRRKFQRRNARFQIEKRQVRSLRGVLRAHFIPLLAVSQRDVSPTVHSY